MPSNQNKTLKTGLFLCNMDGFYVPKKSFRQ